MGAEMTLLTWQKAVMTTEQGPEQNPGKRPETNPVV